MLEKKIIEKIAKCEKPLILIPQKPDSDAVGAAMGLYLAMQNMNKNPTIACSRRISGKYLYIPGTSEILGELTGRKEYCISFDLSCENIESVAAENRDGKAIVKIAIKGGSILAESMKLRKNFLSFDLAVGVSLRRFEEAGRLYNANKEAISELDAIIISNKKSGGLKEMGIWDESRTVSEIVYEILAEIGTEMNSSDVAMALLSGIIGGTNNFQSKILDFKTFEIAARLMSRGADREKVLKEIKKPDLLFEAYKITDEIAGSKARLCEFAGLSSKIKKYDISGRATGYEKALLVAIVSIFIFQAMRQAKSGENDMKGGNLPIKLPERSIAYAVSELPISQSESFLQSLSEESDSGESDEGEKHGSNANIAQTGIKNGNINDGKSNAETEVRIFSEKDEVKISYPRTITIKKIGLRAEIEQVGLTDSGSVETPSSEKVAGWYKFGSRPGEKGNAVIVGHRDSAVNPNGIFRRLGDLKSGDIIEVTDNGNITYKYKMVKKEIYGDSNAPMQEIFGQTEKKMLNLITCVGAWNVQEGNYEKRVVIYSELI